MKIVDTVFTHDNVIIVTIDKLPNEKDTLAKVFDVITQHKMNIDMISCLHSCKRELCISFSTYKGEIDSLIKAIKTLKTIYNGAVTHICGANTKIVLRGKMESERGIAAQVFKVLGENGVEIRLITTSINEISLVVAEGDEDTALSALCREFDG